MTNYQKRKNGLYANVDALQAMGHDICVSLGGEPNRFTFDNKDGNVTYDRGLTLSEAESFFCGFVAGVRSWENNSLTSKPNY